MKPTVLVCKAFFRAGLYCAVLGVTLSTAVPAFADELSGKVAGQAPGSVGATKFVAAPAASAWDELSRRNSWIFLGDSNTYSGGYVAVLDAWFAEAKKRGGEDLDLDFPKLLNLGVSSETASGESEVDHPFKRPCVHERVRKVLRMTQPGVVFVCYGMNDGIYEPPSEENLAAYRDGMLRLADAVAESGAKLVCLTPPIFEAEPVGRKGKFGPTELGRYAYFAPFRDYDRVLEEQAVWCLENRLGAELVIDLRTPLLEEKKRQLADDPEFAFSKDGVHFGSLAHAIVAETILKSLSAPQNVLDAYPSDEAIAASRKKMILLRDAYLSGTGKNRPGLAPGLPIWLAERIAR